MPFFGGGGGGGRVGSRPSSSPPPPAAATGGMWWEGLLGSMLLGAPEGNKIVNLPLQLFVGNTETLTFEPERVVLHCGTSVL